MIDIDTLQETHTWQYILTVNPVSVDGCCYAQSLLQLCPLPRARMKSGQAASPPSSPTDLFLSAWDHGVSLVVLASWLANDRQGCIFSSALE